MASGASASGSAEVGTGGANPMLAKVEFIPNSAGNIQSSRRPCPSCFSGIMDCAELRRGHDRNVPPRSGIAGYSARKCNARSGRTADMKAPGPPVATNLSCSRDSVWRPPCPSFPPFLGQTPRLPRRATTSTRGSATGMSIRLGHHQLRTSSMTTRSRCVREIRFSPEVVEMTMT